MSDTKDKPEERHSMGINVDQDGTPTVMAYTTQQVDQIVAKAMSDGEIVAGVFRMRDGSIAIQVLEPPSHAMLDVFEAIVVSYRQLLRVN